MKCKNCGKLTHKIGKSFTKYCNVQCKDEYYNWSRKLHFDNKPCEFCNSMFLPTQTKQKYCTPDCNRKAKAIAALRTPSIKKCSFCNKEYQPFSSLQKFCSANCRVGTVKSKRKWNYTPEQLSNIMGEKNPAYRHGERIVGKKPDGTGIALFHKNRDFYKRDMVEEHGYLFCEKCGATNTKFETHHIIYRSEKPRHEYLHDKINLIHLCVKCHNWFHLHKRNRNELVVKRGLAEIFGNSVLDK